MTDDLCARRRCGHPKSWHASGTGECLSVRENSTSCRGDELAHCPVFLPKDGS
jgi:hypothetical protein